MKKMITLLVLHFTLLALVQQTAFAGNVGEVETTIKKQQVTDLKIKCPHYPAASTGVSGPSKTASITIESWKKSYPEEYKAYQKIFNSAK
jgi:hypothetical protein